MKIIKEGKKKKDQKKTKSCSYCECVFEYEPSDVRSDFKEGSYVVCPNDDCKHFLSV